MLNNFYKKNVEQNISGSAALSINTGMVSEPEPPGDVVFGRSRHFGTAPAPA